MKKYSTPEIELEVFKTSDVITASLLSWTQEGASGEIAWDDGRWDPIQ